MPQSKKTSDLTVEALIDVWDGVVRKLVEKGVPAGRIAESLWIAGSRAEALHASDPMTKLAAAAERLRLQAEAGLRGEEPAEEPALVEEGGYTGPERRGPGRPWQRAET
jgi:hypothetical protein